jgi:hypothetical protein
MEHLDAPCPTYSRDVDAIPTESNWSAALGVSSLDDEWQDGRRHFSQQSMARLLHPAGPRLLTNPLTGGIAA